MKILMKILPSSTKPRNFFLATKWPKVGYKMVFIKISVKKNVFNTFQYFDKKIWPFKNINKLVKKVLRVNLAKWLPRLGQ
jgi:hypothetical protein